MQRFSDQVAIITGGARGIGKGLAERLGKEGATVILFDALAWELKGAEEDLLDKGLKVQSTVVDITKEAIVKTAVDRVADKFGKIDIMVNCAGIVGPTSTKITAYNYSDFQKVIRTNLDGTFLMTKYTLPHMLKQNYGRILLLSSIGGKEGNPGMVGYAASKEGEMGLVKGVGKEYAETGITINGLAPAVIGTPMNLETDPAMLDYMSAKIPMGRIGTVEEVASIAAWIVSKEASFNTGFVFDLSGGRETY